MVDAIPTATDVPAPLLEMRKITGTLESPGPGDNPVILGWANAIARRFPKMLKYCANYTHDSIAWCGLAVAYVMSQAGIEPPFDASDDLHSFLWADSWRTWGTSVPIDQARPGDVLVFKWASGEHHVTMHDGETADSFICRGGNQSDAVKVSNYLKSMCTGVRRAPDAAAVPMPVESSIAISKQNNFEACLAVVLKWEGGNDDDPNDPGGRTSRGILQREWNVWRQSHPNLPTDVWQAPQAEVVAIYHQSYWDVVRGDELPNGVDLAMFDYAVNSGVGKVRELQKIVGTDVDGEIGPNTIAAVAAYVGQHGAIELVQFLCNQRMGFLRGLKTWPTFGKGWANRVNDVEKTAIAMTKAAPVVKPAPIPLPEQGPGPTPRPAPVPVTDPYSLSILARTLDSLDRRIAALEKVPMTTTPSPTQAGAGSSARVDIPAIFAMVQQLSGMLPEVMARVQQVEKMVAGLKVGGTLQGIQWPGSAAAVDPATATPVTVTPTAPVDATNKTGLGAGILGLITALGLGAAGVTGTPMGEAATTTGQVLPLLAGGVSLLGAFGKLAPLLRAAMVFL